MVSFQLELGLDLGLGEAEATQVATLFEYCGEFRLGDIQRRAGPPAAVGRLWMLPRYGVAPRWPLVNSCWCPGTKNRRGKLRPAVAILFFRGRVRQLRRVPEE